MTPLTCFAVDTDDTLCSWHS